jgi:hypothetical protein
LGGELRLGGAGRVEFSVDTANVMRHKVSFGVSGLIFEVLAEELKFLR